MSVPPVSVESVEAACDVLLRTITVHAVPIPVALLLAKRIRNSALKASIPSATTSGSPSAVDSAVHDVLFHIFREFGALEEIVVGIDRDIATTPHVSGSGSGSADAEDENDDSVAGRRGGERRGASVTVRAGDQFGTVSCSVVFVNAASALAVMRDAVRESVDGAPPLHSVKGYLTRMHARWHVEGCCLDKGDAAEPPSRRRARSSSAESESERQRCHPKPPIPVKGTAADVDVAVEVARGGDTVHRSPPALLPSSSRNHNHVMVLHVWPVVPSVYATRFPYLITPNLIFHALRDVCIAKRIVICSSSSGAGGQEGQPPLTVFVQVATAEEMTATQQAFGHDRVTIDLMRPSPRPFDGGKILVERRFQVRYYGRSSAHTAGLQVGFQSATLMALDDEACLTAMLQTTIERKLTSAMTTTASSATAGVTPSSASTKEKPEVMPQRVVMAPPAATSTLTAPKVPVAPAVDVHGSPAHTKVTVGGQQLSRVITSSIPAQSHVFASPPATTSIPTPLPGAVQPRSTAASMTVAAKVVVGATVLPNIPTVSTQIGSLRPSPRDTTIQAETHERVQVLDGDSESTAASVHGRATTTTAAAAVCPPPPPPPPPHGRNPFEKWLWEAVFSEEYQQMYFVGTHKETGAVKTTWENPFVKVAAATLGSLSA